jgi:hypothetical protein
VVQAESLPLLVLEADGTRVELLMSLLEAVILAIERHPANSRDPIPTEITLTTRLLILVFDPITR